MKAEWTNNDSLATSQTTKAILVIDKPESCTSCMLGIYNKRWFCLTTNEDINIADRYNIPKSCPLKPMPSKRKNPITKTFGTPFNKGQAKGWNDCIDEILGENNAIQKEE